VVRVDRLLSRFSLLEKCRFFNQAPAGLDKHRIPPRPAMAARWLQYLDQYMNKKNLILFLVILLGVVAALLLYRDFYKPKKESDHILKEFDNNKRLRDSLNDAYKRQVDSLNLSK
jgi:hypothetical protein